MSCNSNKIRQFLSCNFKKTAIFEFLILAKIGNFDLQFEQMSGIVFIFAASMAFDSLRIFMMSRMYGGIRSQRVK